MTTWRMFASLSVSFSLGAPGQRQLERQTRTTACTGRGDCLEWRRLAASWARAALGGRGRNAETQAETNMMTPTDAEKTARAQPTPYAVVRSGGCQYRVQEGDMVRVARLDAERGGEIQLDEVLMVGYGEEVRVGTPRLEGARVTARVHAHGRHPRILMYKLRRRKHHLKRRGHRQPYTELAITGIYDERADEPAAQVNGGERHGA